MLHLASTTPCSCFPGQHVWIAVGALKGGSGGAAHFLPSHPVADSARKEHGSQNHKAPRALFHHRAWATHTSRFWQWETVGDEFRQITGKKKNKIQLEVALPGTRPGVGKLQIKLSEMLCVLGAQTKLFYALLEFLFIVSSETHPGSLQYPRL